MKKIRIFIITLIVCGQGVYSQNEVQEMNVIKDNPNYLYATGTSIVSTEDASQNAKDLLNAEIEYWLKNNAESDIAGYIAKSQERLGLIKTKRGNLYRVFAYVNKVDILPCNKDQSIICGVFVAKQEITDAKSQMGQDTEMMAKIIPNQEETYVPNDIERELLKIRTFTQLNEYINLGRENGSIIQLGKYSTLPKDGLIYVFIHNKAGNIPACMKISNGEILNLLTCKKDLITNYKGCGAIWIRFK